MDDLTREFLIESQEGLDRMERCLTDLEARPGDRELLAEIFRTVHTIKGATGFLGFERLEGLSHSGENLLGLLRDGKMTATAETISVLLALLDRLRLILRTIESTGAETGARDEDQVVLACLEAQLQSTVEEPVLQEVAAAAASPLRAPKPRKRSRRSAAPPPPSGPQLPEPPSGPVAADQPPVIASAQSPHPDPVAAAPDAAVASFTAASGQSESTLRVDVELLNRMMNLVGELVLTRNQVLQSTSTDASFSQLGRRLDMVTSDLRETVMKARMQPVSQVFSRFPRLIRDLALNLGKRVRLEMEGQETELDKSLLEAIRDPLTHSIRNSIDHGIELPEVRLACGKPAEGTVKLRACHEGSHVIVEVYDDGAGMNIERIRAKAVERQLVDPARAEYMTDREALQLIFLPGFSTAASVTSVSGRGVGMDVVRTNVEKIGGKVEIDSEAGRGTVLRLRIPLTLAIIPALIVRSGGQNFALPQTSLTELVHLAGGEADGRMEWIEDVALYRLRGNMLPLVFLDRLLNCSVREKSTPCDIAILNSEGLRFGLVVDGLADPEEIVVKPLAGVLRDIGFFSGATILGSGEMALILNPGAIAKHAGVTQSAEASEASTDSGSSDAPDYLLVEAAGRRAALPLDSVVRIERIPLSKIECAGNQSVLRIGNSLLPLDDPALCCSASDDPDALVTIVVCRDGERQVGITVSQVLAVTGGQQMAEAGTGAVADGVTLLQEKVTGIVCLSRIPSLDISSGQVLASAAGEDPSQRSAAQEQTQEICSVHVGNTTFGVPIASVLEILDQPEMQQVPLAPPFVGGLVHYRGELLTAVSLRKLLGMDSSQTAQHVLVFENSNGPFGLFVDSVGEVLRVSNQDYEPNPATLDARRQLLFSGEWKQQNQLLVKLDPERLDPVHLLRALPV